MYLEGRYSVLWCGKYKGLSLRIVGECGILLEEFFEEKKLNAAKTLLFRRGGFMNTYENKIMEDIEGVKAGCYGDMDHLHKYPPEISRQILRILIEWACQPQNDTPIILARKKMDEIDKEWLKTCFLKVAKECVDFSDYWEYRRLLELIVLVLPEVKQEALKLCEDSENEDILEVIEDYKEEAI